MHVVGPHPRDTAELGDNSGFGMAPLSPMACYKVSIDHSIRSPMVPQPSGNLSIGTIAQAVGQRSNSYERGEVHQKRKHPGICKAGK